jgi:hypothetical protein
LRRGHGSGPTSHETTQTRTPGTGESPLGDCRVATTVCVDVVELEPRELEEPLEPDEPDDEDENPDDDELDDDAVDDELEDEEDDDEDDPALDEELEPVVGAVGESPHPVVSPAAANRVPCDKSSRRARRA